MKYSEMFNREIAVVSLSLFLFPGCVATQDWVQSWTKEQLFPVEKRVSENEARITKNNDRLDTMANQIANLDSRLNQTNAKADQALENFQRLKLERKLVLDMRQGAMFASNSIALTEQSKKDIDSFLSDVIGQAGGINDLLFVVAGYTDNTGSAKYNYELALLRAANTASYLTTDKKIDPGRTLVMSYGENSPVADNRTEAGRAKNRRVELLVYRDAVTLGSAQQAQPKR